MVVHFPLYKVTGIRFDAANIYTRNFNPNYSGFPQTFHKKTYRIIEQFPMKYRTFGLNYRAKVIERGWEDGKFYLIPIRKLTLERWHGESVACLTIWQIAATQSEKIGRQSDRNEGVWHRPKAWSGMWFTFYFYFHHIPPSFKLLPYLRMGIVRQ